MRLKTLGVLLLTATAIGIMLFWLTDAMRREAIAVRLRHDEEPLQTVVDTAELAARRKTDRTDHCREQQHKSSGDAVVGAA